jgi:hypothetical protein
MSLSLEEAGRARTWNTAIAAVILGPEVPYQDIGHDHRWDGLGGFSVDRRDGAWWCFGTSEGGYSAVALARFLLKGSSWHDAEAWVRAFISQHQGTGPCVSDVADDDASETRTLISAFKARQIRAAAGPIDGTDGERYLDARGLGRALYPIELKWLDAARAGEGAIVVDLIASGRPVAILCTYIDALARKSAHQPNRRRYNLEPGHPDAVMEIAPAATGAVDIACDCVAVEGLENLLSIALVRQPAWRLVGLPGIGTLQHLSPARNRERWIVFQDSDPEDSSAAQGLEAGVDALLLGGAVVRVTRRAAGDANALLQDPEHGLRALRRLLAEPAGAPLSFTGETRRLADLPPTEYEKARKGAAAAHGVRVGHLDREVEKLRPKRLDEEEAAAEGYREPEDLPFDGPVPALSHILDSAVAAMPRFLIAPKHYYDVIALWSCASYLVQSERVALPIMPQLAFQSAGPESGKSTGLEITATLSYRGRLRSSYTASTVFRRINEEQATMCLVDLHTVLTDPCSELHQVVKACHRRAEAIVDRTEENSGRGRYIKAYRCWAALAWASIGPLFDEMQSRAIILPLRPALPEESRDLDHSSPGLCQALIDCRRQFAAWAPTITAPLDPVVPEPLYSRLADNWRPLVAIAELAKGDWPQRVLTAIEELRRIEHRPSLMTRLLTAIRDAFDAKAQADTVAAAISTGRPEPEPEELAAIAAAPDTQLTTQALLEALNNNEESGLREAHHGRPINVYWLRDHFRDLPIRVEDWWEGPARARKHRSGYYRHQFDDTFERYRIPSSTLSSTSGVSGASSSAAEDTSTSASFPAPDAAPDAAAASGAGKAAKSAAEIGAAPPAPHAPDAGTRMREQTHAETDRDGADGEGSIPAAVEKPQDFSHANGEDPAPPPRQARRRCKPPKGEAAPDLCLPPAPVPPYQPGTWDAALVDEVRRLHQENPKRSIAWLGKRTGQPRSVVQAILRPAGAAE